MKLKPLGFAILATVLTTTLCFGQQSIQPMTNSDVIAMVSAAMSDGLIVDKIHAAPSTAFDTSIEGLKALQTAKVSDTVMRAMINPKPTERPQATADFNDPASPHATGIYMYAKTEDGMQMTLLEPTVYQGATGGGGAFLLTFGIAKAKLKAVVRGAHAAVKSNDDGMAFYFYFNEGSSAFEPWGVPTSPNEFTLLRFEQKKDSRETVIASGNAFGASAGADKKASTGFSFAKIKPGVYKVTPETPFTPGEYCFLVPSSLQRYYDRPVDADRLFDFAVLPAAQAAGSMSAAVMK